MPFFFEAAILSRIRSPVTSRSNWAKDRRTFRVNRPMLVVVLNDWVTETNDTRCASKSSTSLAKSARERADQKAPWAAKIAAAIAILDRGWGKPMQPVDANVNIFDQMTDDEQEILLAAMAALRAAKEDPPEPLN